METSLATLISKNKDKLVDRAAISLKSMFGIAYADVAQEELEERLYRLFDAFIEITRRSAPDPTLVQEIVESVMVTPVYRGWNNRAITEEVLQVVDMVINRLIEQNLSTPELATDKKNSQELLALSIRTAKDVVNGQARRQFEGKKRRQIQPATEPENEAEAEVV
ncbi:MAG TPA: hypothetical protein VH186_31090 [Chloroflexia bacterium]|nr:hypothetical protein [Chloroflexia bacterium]